MSVNGTLVEAKMCTFTLECTHFILNKCPIYTDDDACAKFRTNSHETDNIASCKVHYRNAQENPFFTFGKWIC
jgi:hypothetical protein